MTPFCPITERQTLPVLGVPIDAVSFLEAQDRIMAWGHGRHSRYVVLANVHVTVTASRDIDFAAVVRAADMVTPDGVPVTLMLRKLGSLGQERVSGPDLTWALLGRCEAEGLPVYFYGSTPETLARLFERIRAVFPQLTMAGDSPPFRSLSVQEDEEAIARMHASDAGLVFVGLGCPKQEQWMATHRGRINAVMLGVGAAFDYHAGTIKRAPAWMQNSGLEWFHRLLSEPQRLWKRYLVTNTLFIFGAIKQIISGVSKR